MKTLSRIVRRHICRANHAWKVMQTVSLILEYEDVRRISPNNPWLCLYETLCTILGGQCHVGMSWLLIASSTLSPNIKRNVWEIREICCNIENSLAKWSQLKGTKDESWHVRSSSNMSVCRNLLVQCSKPLVVSYGDVICSGGLVDQEKVTYISVRISVNKMVKNHQPTEYQIKFFQRIWKRS